MLGARFAEEKKTVWSFFNFRKDICPAKSLFERRSVTSRYNAQNFWMTTTGSLSNNDGDGNENGKKTKGLD